LVAYILEIESDDFLRISYSGFYIGALALGLEDFKLVSKNTVLPQHVELNRFCGLVLKDFRLVSKGSFSENQTILSSHFVDCFESTFQFVATSSVFGGLWWV